MKKVVFVDCTEEMISITGLWFHLVRSKSLLRQEAIHHRIAEGAGVAAGLPDFRVHDDGGFEADHVFALLRHAAPPKFFHVALQFRAERTVIPEPVDASVNLRRLENESASFAQRHDFFHQGSFFRLGHEAGSFLEAPTDVKGGAEWQWYSSVGQGP